MRNIIFGNGEYYHLYNRGVDKRNIFLRDSQYTRFIRTFYLIQETGSATQRLIYNQSLALKSKMSVICYSLMPNHYHFLVKQLQDNGITEFMHKLNTSYTKYFNLNLKRAGRLFEFTFKAKRIESEEVLLHISRYIHLNALIGGLTKSLYYYPWSSWNVYAHDYVDKIVNKEEILRYFSKSNAIKEYTEFVEDQIAYSRLLKEIKDYDSDEDRIFI